MAKVQKLQRKTNTELLSSNKRRKPLKGGKPVVFDEKEREEFLTGFRKRNLELKKAKKERYEKKIKEEKLQKRREKRQKLKSVLDEITAEIQEEGHAISVVGLPETTTEVFQGEDCITSVVTEPLEL